MGIFSKFNKVRKFNFDTTDLPYVSLEEVYEDLLSQCDGVEEEVAITPVIVRALFINGKSKYGEAPVLATDGMLINLPAHLTDSVKSIISDDDAVNAINMEHCCIYIRPYVQKKYNKVCYTVEFADFNER